MKIRHRVKPEQTKQMASSSNSSGEITSPWTRSCQFLATTKKINQFSDGREPKLKFLILKIFYLFVFILIIKPNYRVIYTAGAFDLFHCGLLDFLEKAKQKGSYLVVGIHNDPVIEFLLSLK